MRKDDADVGKAFMSDNALFCWSCHTKILKRGFFCEYCNIIQPLSGLSVFDIFDLQETFIIDEKQLEQKYFTLQHQLHPDRFSGKTAKEKMLASQQSMAVNDAYHILKNPLDRADCLLVLMGGTSYKKEEARNIPPELLMNAMMQREKLNQAKDNEEFQTLLKQSQKKQLEIIKEIEVAFENKDIKTLESTLLNLQYEQKFMQEIKQKIG